MLKKKKKQKHLPHVKYSILHRVPEPLEVLVTSTHFWTNASVILIQHF